MSGTRGADPRLERALADAYERTRWLERVRHERAGVFHPGDLLMIPFPETGDDLIQWALVLRRGGPPALDYIVPADFFPMAGTADVGVPEDSACGPLALRCGLGLWASAKSLAGAVLCGVLDSESIREAAQTVAEIDSGTLDGTPLARETDEHAEYRHHIALLSDVVKQLKTRLESEVAEDSAAAAGSGQPAVIDAAGAPPIVAIAAGAVQQPDGAAGDLAAEPQPAARGKLVRFFRSRTATGLAAAAAVLILTQLVPFAWRDDTREAHTGSRSTRARIRAFDDLGGAELLHGVLEKADADSKATDEPLDVSYLAGLAGAIRSLADEMETSPEGIGERVVELRLICSLLLREPPAELTKASRDALLEIARSAADNADKIREELEARGKPEALRERLKALVGATVRQLNEVRERSASRAR